MTARAIGQLSETDWPCLECLYLKHTSTSVAAMSSLVQGRWPNLSVLDISGVAVRTSSLQMLRQHSNGIRHLGLTVNLGKPAVFNLFAAECEDSQQLWHLQNLAALPVAYFVVTRQPRRWQLPNVQQTLFDLPKLEQASCPTCCFRLTCALANMLSQGMLCVEFILLRCCLFRVEHTLSLRLLDVFIFYGLHSAI